MREGAPSPEADQDLLDEGEMRAIINNINKDFGENRIVIEDGRFNIDDGAAKVRPVRTYFNALTGKEAPLEEFLRGLLDR